MLINCISIRFVFRKKLIEMGVLTKDDSSKIDQEINREIEEAVKFAEESPFPAPEATVGSQAASGESLIEACGCVR